MSPAERPADRITTADSRFQELVALLSNRTKRHRGRRFVVQGVRPVTLAVERGWPIETALIRAGGRRSDWSQELLSRLGDAPRVVVAPELFAQLAEKDEPGELLLVAGVPSRSLGDVHAAEDTCLVVCDRIAGPGNLGSIIRSADAFGADAVVVAGHAADPYDPQCVRASTGSLFCIPVVAAESLAPVATWVASARDGGVRVRVLGGDEGAEPLRPDSLRGPVVLVLGDERSGLSRAALDLCDDLVSIPMRSGGASSLNVATAASILLYEASRTRG